MHILMCVEELHDSDSFSSSAMCHHHSCFCTFNFAFAFAAITQRHEQDKFNALMPGCL